MKRIKPKVQNQTSSFFLILLPNFINAFVDIDSQAYTFLAELIHIDQIIYLPVIKIENIQGFKVLIENYVRKFKDLFSDKKLIPK